MHDTSQAARQRYFDLLSRQSPAARLRTAAKLTRSVRALAACAISIEEPNASRERRNARLAERLYGREIAERLFPTAWRDGG
jgi:hypothetical protein